MEKKIDSKYKKLIFTIGLGALGVKADEIIKENGLHESSKIDIINSILEKNYTEEDKL